MLKQIVYKIYNANYLAYLLLGIASVEAFFTICHMAHATVWWYIISFIFCAAVMFGKEFIYDKWLKQGTFDWMNIILGGSGMVLVAIQWLLLLI